MYSNANKQTLSTPSFRDVTTTARLFNFNRPVYMTDMVWSDCVDIQNRNRHSMDELAVLQRLRHVLFMASSALHGRVRELECEFSVHRVPNDAEQSRPESTTLKLVAHNDRHNQPVITIKLPAE